MSPCRKDDAHVTQWNGPSATHHEASIGFVGPRGLGIQGPCVTIPVVHLLLDENHENCFQGSCICGWKTAPFTEYELAVVDSWRHAFGERISDLRKAQLRAFEMLDEPEESVSATG